MLLRQPQYGPLQVDWAHPVAQHVMTACVVLGDRLYAITRKGVSSYVVGTPVRNKYGPALKFNGAEYVDIIDADLPTNKTATLVMVGAVRSSGNEFFMTCGDYRIGLARHWGSLILANSGGSSLYGPAISDSQEGVFGAGFDEASGTGYVALDGTLVTEAAFTISYSPSYLRIGARSDGQGKFTGEVNAALLLDSAHPELIKSVTANPWQVFVDYTDVEVLKSSAGGATVITCNTGTATTAGIAAGISSATTLACNVGNATTAGVACALPIKIACNVGNATPTGIACWLPVVVQCNAGTATTAGVSASISLDTSITISCNAGTATTAGISAVFPQTISCTPGNATTAGVTAGIAGTTTISCNVGNASVAGITANIPSATTISCNAGTATTAGVSATFPQTLSCNAGNATTAGITAQVDIAGQIVIGCNAGTATTAGVSANISSAFVMACNAGNATTLGSTAYFPQSLQCTPGNAIALGIGATFTVSGPTTIVCNVGNAAASGIQASIYDVVAPGPRLLVVASESRGYDMAIEVRQYSTEDA